jgi:predicted alpha/beta superfamily hydrolase
MLKIENTVKNAMHCPMRIIAALVLAISCGGAHAGGKQVSQVEVSTALPNVIVLPTQLAMPGLNRQRTLRIYLPPGYSKSEVRYPVLYMHDGQNLFDAATAYAGEWGVDETLNELARTKGLEIIVVGVDNGGDKRMTELNAWDNPRFGKAEGKQYMDFMVNVVKPMIDTNYRTRPERQYTGIMGSSMGGLISQYAIQQYPNIFSKAGIFSPAYWTAPDVFGFTASNPLAADARMYLYMGGREGEEGLEGSNRMALQLQHQAHPVNNFLYRISPSAEHNEAAWRAEFAAAVSWLFSAEK